MTITTVLATATHRPDVNDDAGRYASRHIFGTDDGFEKHASLTILRDGIVCAVIILHNWQPEAGTIELSAAGSGYWQTRRVVREIFGICFDTMGCQMILMRNSAKDEATVDNSRRLGFTGILLPRMRGRYEDEWLFTLTDDQWKSSRLYKRP